MSEAIFLLKEDLCIDTQPAATGPTVGRQGYRCHSKAVKVIVMLNFSAPNSQYPSMCHMSHLTMSSVRLH